MGKPFAVFKPSFSYPDSRQLDMGQTRDEPKKLVTTADHGAVETDAAEDPPQVVKKAPAELEPLETQAEEPKLNVSKSLAFTEEAEQIVEGKSTAVDAATVLEELLHESGEPRGDLPGELHTQARLQMLQEQLERAEERAKKADFENASLRKDLLLWQAIQDITIPPRQHSPLTLALEPFSP
eukprot:CAMPEP_0197681982 /NCGR_PEP_ID=MMETSP1338-20131121/95791_1 /TAXON_ID=43686 ORGANISM="Pelagodinium beii, Strain RCC1491" /NCGR_SAMPLE_ID=MMETSP1338 /ASSEMBLY_ACC=CAM_ASM_000754 /LENGTH=181 /DNA_ID=CAMNT_0043263395 /DNA_START=204 /DNA_END=746 /DNA_ORIENTATION=+